MDSVCGDKEPVVVHKNPKEVPMKTALTTKMEMETERRRFVLKNTAKLKKNLDFDRFKSLYTKKRRFRPRRNRFGGGRNRGQRQQGQDGEESGEGGETTGDDGAPRSGNASNGRRRRFYKRNFRQRKPGNENAGDGEQKDGDNAANGNARRQRKPRFRPRNRPNKNRSGEQVNFLMDFH